MAINSLLQQRALTQIADKNETPHKCFATENLWVSYEQVFSSPVGGNEVMPLTSGKQYFEELIKAVRAASKEIYITGWQVNWDAMLGPNLRLFDLLLEAARNGCNIYVLPWNDNSPVQTYDEQTQSVLLTINRLVKRDCVRVLLSATTADKAESFFSHHQKLVVVDHKIAFVGGIDIAYGRYDDDNFTLHADAEGRAALNRYNGCVIAIGTLAPESVVDPDLLTGQVDRWKNAETIQTKINAGAYQAPYAEDSKMSAMSPDAIYETLDPATQPRMPWQDVHLMIQGPSVATLTRNFVFRWNVSASPTKSLPIPPQEEEKTGGCYIQVLRSASAAMRSSEYFKIPVNERKRFKKPSGPQNDILRAMTILIDKAQHFIYIENQFFVSAFGSDTVGAFANSGPAALVSKKDSSGATATTWVPGDSKQLPQNDICASLASRIGRAILDPAKPNFHVYITLPVYSEGRLDSGSIITQIHWTMQSLVFGSMSLLNRIRRFIKARELYENKDGDWGRALREDNSEYSSVKIEDCFQYVTLLNLRTWEKLGDRYVTEQVYVHSKLMIVDDRFAIVGSANINDRSLLGRDSELAVMMMDSEVEKVDLCGDGKLRPTRSAVRKLRTDIWRKIFGIKGGVRPATELRAAIDKPADPKSWKAIQAVAEANAKLYEAAFDWVPRNKNLRGKPEKGIFPPASIWPNWEPTSRNQDGSLRPNAKPMPFDKKFWSAPQHNPAAVKLGAVKGYITLLPIDWTKGENNNIGYHTWLVTKNEKSAPNLPTRRSTMFGQVPTDGTKV